ncbi:hypothetical protein MnTg02_00087 [bacterium MnTg02]|nr:hypothetical protein MnTg02_00087 [bacterium MnTg02]
MEYAVKIILIALVVFVGVIFFLVAKDFLNGWMIYGGIPFSVVGICYLIWKLIP